jgi:RNA polymerase sigma-70 factor (ECF subfamily)
LTIQTRPVITREDYPSREEGAAERDRLLVEAHLHSDPDAFAIIVDDHWDALISQARATLGPNAGAAEDVVQETFERALKYMPRFGRTGEYRLGAWLNQILRSVIQNHWERTAREVRSAQRSVNERDFEVDVADRVGDPVVAEALQRRIRGLPEPQRAAFVMREVVGLPYADVARALNVSEDNVRARVSRSKDKLRRSTEGLRSAVGAAIAAPFGWRFFHRDKSGARAGDQVAVQFTSSPIGQTIVSLATVTVPRGSLVFGIAATVATIGTGTVLLANSTQSGPTPAPRVTPAVLPASANTAGAATGATATAAVVAPTSPPSTPASSYSWVNAGTGATSPVPTAALPAATCNSVPANANAGWAGPALGLSNALSVAVSNPVDLPTVGSSSLTFSSVADVHPFGQQGPGASAIVVTDACVSSSGQWFSATISGVGGPLALQGTLVQVLGAANETSYIFRGSVPASAVPGDPLAGSVQFVADLTVLEPDNTAQLTIVFLGASVSPAGTQAAAADPSSTSATSPGAGGVQTGTTGTAPAPANGTSSMPGFQPTLPGQTALSDGVYAAATQGASGIPQAGASELTTVLGPGGSSPASGHGTASPFGLTFP